MISVNRTVHIVGSGGMARDLKQEIVANEKWSPTFKTYSEIGDALPMSQFPSPEERSKAKFAIESTVFIAVGDPRLKKRFCDLYEIKNAKNIYIRNPYFGDRSTVGYCCTFLANTSIGHDSVIGDYVTMMPGSRVSGNCKIGEGVMIGANATILPGISIGAWSEIGAGAVISHSIGEGEVWCSPGARRVK